MNVSKRDSTMSWVCRDGEYGFEVTQLAVEDAYRWMLKTIAEARAQRDMTSVLPEPVALMLKGLPSIEQAVEILALDKWGRKSLDASLSEWV